MCFKERGKLAFHEWKDTALRLSNEVLEMKLKLDHYLTSFHLMVCVVYMNVSKAITRKVDLTHFSVQYETIKHEQWKDLDDNLVKG